MSRLHPKKTAEEKEEKLYKRRTWSVGEGIIISLLSAVLVGGGSLSYSLIERVSKSEENAEGLEKRVVKQEKFKGKYEVDNIKLIKDVSTILTEIKFISKDIKELVETDNEFKRRFNICRDVITINPGVML